MPGSLAPVRPAGHPGGRRPPWRLPSPYQAPGLTVCWVLSFHGPDSELQLDIPTINIWFTYKISRRGTWTFLISRHTQGVDCILPASDHAMGVALIGIPRIPPARTQGECRFTQVIHRFVHRKAWSASWAVRQQRVGRGRQSVIAGTGLWRVTASWPLRTRLTWGGLRVPG